MWGDYGYMEEGPLGKPYNLKLLRRLAVYALPYKKIIAWALFFIIVITLLDLALPYLTKIAIDRYILSSWYRVDLLKIEERGEQDFLKRYGHFIGKSKDGASGLISHIDLKTVDPTNLNNLKRMGVLSDKRYYIIEADHRGILESVANHGSAMTMENGTLAVPLEDMHRLDGKQILDLRARDVRGVAILAVILFVILIATFVLGYAQYYLMELTGQKIMQDIRVQLFERMQSQSLTFFDRHPVGRLVTRVTNDIENLNEMFKSVIVTVFKDIFVLTGILVVLLYLNWRLALVCFTLIPIIFVITLLFSNLAREAFRELRAKISKINAFLQERISGMRIIQLFAVEAFQMKGFSRINHENYLAGMRQIRVFAVFMPIMELFAALAVALLIWHGGGKVISEQLTLGSLVAFISYIRMFFRPIRDISEKYNIMQSAMASTERIMEFMDHGEVIPDPKEPKDPTDVQGYIEFKAVSFSYQDEHPVLDNVSFQVKPGEMVAIVGATGAGKTTMASLLDRFYDVKDGSVLVDGIDVRQWSKSNLRSNIGLVMQDVFIFAGSLKDNITLGKEAIDAAGINRAIELANAQSFIKKLPGGLNQEVGEGGATLSAGERQLLSFARALAFNPKVLILDEATSSVDPETERLIQEAIVRMTKMHTTLVIAHRLSTIRHADRIIVVHHGKIREQGTHDELMALGGYYFKLNKFREAQL